MKFHYALDGSENRNTIVMGRGMQVQKSTAVWEDGKLILTMFYDVADAGSTQPIECEVTQRLSLQNPRQAVGEVSLVIETTRCGVLGGLPTTTQMVYTKR